MPKIKTKTDYVGMWFKARKAFGIDDNMSGGWLDPVSNQVHHWQPYHHSEMDGLGGMAMAMRKAGYPSQELPKSSDKSRPSLLALLKMILQPAKQQVKKQIRWKHNYQAEKGAQGEVNYTIVSEEELQQMKKLARRQKVTLNHYVFWALNRAVAKHLLVSNQQYYWLYPINLRGPLDFGTDYFNYSSAIDVLASDNISAKNLHENVKAEIRSKRYWLNWHLANIGKIIGFRGVKYIYAKISGKVYLAGSFSFLGQWPLAADQTSKPDNGYTWVSCGIGTPNYPISTGVVLWYKRMSLAIKLHPSICQDSHIATACINDWKSFMLSANLQD